MQSSNPSKKKRKIADEKSAPAPEATVAAEPQMSSRFVTSSRKKTDTLVDAGAGKTHRKLSSPLSLDASRQESPVDEPAKTMGAAAGAEQTFTTREVSEEEIAKLAHSYWVERGYAHGHSNADWLRAEQELNASAKRN